MMSEKIISLVVPAENSLREEIRRSADEFLRTNPTEPPVSFNRLSELAGRLLSENKWDDELKAFTMVCCGNAVWRPIVETIPYQRRMLLLPHCLKNSRKCTAPEDEFGLLCRECGNCNIPEFTQEAERLGYITIVAEGTTIASQLIESGRVDAIIGVGCMETLQKIFREVSNYAVPAIGVPLISSGCTDTIADKQWIMEELGNYRNNGNLHLVNLNDLRGKIEPLFTENEIIRLLNLSQNPADAIILELMLAGGKRIRPLLTALAYQTYSNNNDPELLKLLAVSIECFHKASLVHDDIEDGDEFRYGKQTLHARHGIPVAVNTGDLLIGEGYRLLSECKIDYRIKSDCIKTAAEGHRAMSAGQGYELMARKSNIIPSVTEVLKIFENKTGQAFKVSLLTGAIAGGADSGSTEILSRFSLMTGIAYQLKDDLEDLSDKNSAGLRNPSVLISMLAEKAGPEENDSIVNAVRNNSNDEIRIMIDEYGIGSGAEDMIREFLGNINACLSEVKNLPLKLALHEIVGKTFSKYL